MKRKFFMLLFVLACTIAVSAQQAVYKYYPRIAMGSTVEQVKQKMKSLSDYKLYSDDINSIMPRLVYLWNGTTQIVLRFSEGKLSKMQLFYDFTGIEFKIIHDQLIEELKAAGKDYEGVYVDESLAGLTLVHSHMLDLSKTNVATFRMGTGGSGYKYDIWIIDKEMKEYLIKDKIGYAGSLFKAIGM